MSNQRVLRAVSTMSTNVKHMIGQMWVASLPAILLALVQPLFAGMGMPVVDGEWSNPELLYATRSAEMSNTGWLLSDEQGQLHAWWPVFPVGDDGRQQTAVWYSEWNTQQWMPPRDILLWSAAGGMTSVVTDGDGNYHGFSATDCVSHVMVKRESAYDPLAWGSRRCLAESGNSELFAAAGPDGITIYVVFANAGGDSLQLLVSENSGKTWAVSNTIVEGSQEGFLVDPALSVDQEGRLHLVWSVMAFPDGYPPLGVFYSRSDDGGYSWSAPMLLRGENEGQPAITAFNEDVHVVWNGDAAMTGRYYRGSADAGRTWKPVEELIPPSLSSGGLQRAPAIITDGLGNLHALIHDGESLYYFSRDESGWLNYGQLYVPARISAHEVRSVRLAITEGNTLHALYTVEIRAKEDSEEAVFKVFYQQRRIDAPAQPVVPDVPPTNVAMTYEAFPEATGEAVSGSQRTSHFRSSRNNRNENGLLAGAPPIFFGGGAAALTVALVLVARRAKTWRSE